MSGMQPRFTAIWQYENAYERQWIDEIFGPYIDRHVFDGQRRLVLDRSILFDSFTYSEAPEYYRQFRGKNAFLVEFLDEYYQGHDYAVYRNFKGVFRNFWSALFDSRFVRALPLGYQNGVRGGSEDITPASSREFVWSMVGDCQKSSRPDAVRALSRVEPYFLRAFDRPFGDAAAAAPARFGREEYRDVLRRSMFVPCPMGNANLESYRTYEALECGAIPIVEKRWTLNYYRHLLGPEFPGLVMPSWSAARAEVERVTRSRAELDARQDRCIQWWREYKQTLLLSAGDFLARRLGSEEPVNPLRWVNRVGPVLQWLELARHHSLPALARRFTRQFARLRAEGRWREAKTGWRPLE